MQIYHFTCKDCGYELTIPLGSSDLDQVLTDANADYADYHLFRCDKESEFVHADIHDIDFEGKCATHRSKIKETNREMRPIKCPHCNGALTIKASSPLADIDGTSAQ